MLRSFMHDVWYMHIGVKRDGSGFAGGQKGFLDREHFFLSSTFLGLVSVTPLPGGWLVSSSIFIIYTTIKLHFSWMGKLSVFVSPCMHTVYM